jgi:hypothetical protein
MMHTPLTHLNLANAVYHLEQLQPDDQWAALEQLQATGRAALHTPQPRNTWDSQVWSIRLHEVEATGADRDEALHNWIRMATYATFAQTDAPDLLAWAIQTLASDSIAMAEAVDAARIIGSHPGPLDDIDRARADATLDAISQSEGISIADLTRHGLPVARRARAGAA